MAEALTREPGLEAVTIDPAQQTISLATLGRADVAELTARVSSRVREAQQPHARSGCGLLAGEDDCLTCDEPLSAAEQSRITVRRDGESLTVAKVRCPTVPKFWRWNQIPLPKVVQRDVEFFEAEEHPGEWKWQLLGAGFCAVFGMAAYLLTPHGTRPLPKFAPEKFGMPGMPPPPC